MSLAQTTGMQHAGTEPWTGFCFRLEESRPSRPSSSPSTYDERPAQQHAAQPALPFLAPDAMVRLGLQKRAQTASPESPTCRPLSAAATSTNWRKPTDKPVDKPTDQTQEAIDAIVAANPVATPNGYATPRSTPPPSGALPDQDKKIYCTHWIRHGECDYTQQGCMYKHEMPNRETLEKIGFRSVPRWWQERTAIRIAGLSSLPTVGTPMKAEEWLKRRSSHASDADDESENKSRSDSESEGDDSAVSTAEKRETSGSTNATSGPDNETRETPAAPSPSDLRKPSVSGDLIDLSPLLPTPSPSSDDSDDPVDKILRQIASSVRQGASDGQWASKHAPKPKSGSASPRKVFVPAGESAEYHISQSRRLAGRPEDRQTPRTQPAEEMQQKFEQSPNKPVQILKREVKSGLGDSKQARNAKQGLMTSIYAPQPNSPAAAGPDNRPQGRQRIEQPATGSQGLTASMHAPQPSKPAATPAGPDNRSQPPQRIERPSTSTQGLTASMHACSPATLMPDAAFVPRATSAQAPGVTRRRRPVSKIARSAHPRMGAVFADLPARRLARARPGTLAMGRLRSLKVT